MRFIYLEIFFGRVSKLFYDVNSCNLWLCMKCKSLMLLNELCVNYVFLCKFILSIVIIFFSWIGVGLLNLSVLGFGLSCGFV